MLTNITSQIPPEQRDRLQKEGIGGIVGVKGFEAGIYSFDGQEKLVNLITAGVWVVLQGNDSERIVFLEQADRTLPNGRNPWEIPSGKVDRSMDKDIWQTATRELREELDINVPVEAIRPLALSIKRKGGQMPLEIPISIGKQDSIWIDSTHIWGKEELDAALIGLVVINIHELKLPLVDFFCRRFPTETVYLDPPAGVSVSEISKIALVPVEHVLDWRYSELEATAHIWASADGLRAFTAVAKPA